MVSLFNSLRQFKDIHMYDFSLKNLIRSKEEEIRKQEADIAKKTHEKALLEQPLSQTPIDACTKCHLRAGHTHANLDRE